MTVDSSKLFNEMIDKSKTDKISIENQIKIGQKPINAVIISRNGEHIIYTYLMDE